MADLSYQDVMSAMSYLESDCNLIASVGDASLPSRFFFKSRVFVRCICNLSRLSPLVGRRQAGWSVGRYALWDTQSA